MANPGTNYQFDDNTTYVLKMSPRQGKALSTWEPSQEDIAKQKKLDKKKRKMERYREKMKSF